jgi:hypothetical protein
VPRPFAVVRVAEDERVVRGDEGVVPATALQLEERVDETPLLVGGQVRLVLAYGLVRDSTVC